MSAIILDTEGTGLWEPDVIELAYVAVDHLEPDQEIADVTVQRFCPTKPITAAAAAVHNIIEQDLVNCPTWPGAWTYAGWSATEPHYLIGHKIDFDWEAIGRPDVRRIDTMCLSQFLWDELDTHKLGAMLYSLLPADHARHLVTGAHGAGADVAMTFLLLGFIVDRAVTERHLPQSPTFEDLWQLSEIARIPLRMSFGKFGPKNGQRGKRYDAVDTSYLQWILRQGDFDEYVMAAARNALTARGY